MGMHTLLAAGTLTKSNSPVAAPPRVAPFIHVPAAPTPGGTGHWRGHGAGVARAVSFFFGSSVDKTARHFFLRRPRHFSRQPGISWDFFSRTHGREAALKGGSGPRGARSASLSSKTIMFVPLLRCPDGADHNIPDSPKDSHGFPRIFMDSWKSRFSLVSLEITGFAWFS
eukprot:gene19318-biopygen13013